MVMGGYIVVGISTVFLFLGIMFFFVGKSVWKCTEMVTGEIVGMCMNAYDYNHGGKGNISIGIEMGGGNRGTTRCPIFVYRVNGVKYDRASNVAWNRGYIKRKMKKPQTIYYNPQNPKQASLLKQSAWSIVGKVFILVGFAALALGLILIKLGA